MDNEPEEYLNQGNRRAYTSNAIGDKRVTEYFSDSVIRTYTEYHDGHVQVEYSGKDEVDTRSWWKRIFG